MHFRVSSFLPTFDKQNFVWVAKKGKAFTMWSGTHSISQPFCLLGFDVSLAHGATRLKDFVTYPKPCIYNPAAETYLRLRLKLPRPLWFIQTRCGLLFVPMPW